MKEGIFFPALTTLTLIKLENHAQAAKSLIEN